MDELVGFILSWRVDYALFIGACVLTLWLCGRRLLVRAGRRVTTRDWVCLGAMLLAGVVLVEDFGAAERGRLRQVIEGFAPTYARELEHMGHAQLGLDVAADDPRYLEMIEAEKRWLAANTNIADVYTMRRRADGKIVLVVDSETDYNHDGSYDEPREQRTELGRVYDEGRAAIIAALAGERVFDDEPVSDEWGTWVSEFVPLHDASGKIEAIVGVDYPASSWNRAVLGARVHAIVAVALVVMLWGATLVIQRLARADAMRRRRSEVLLRRAKDAAEAASEAKSEFLAKMSHEIRTPLNGVSGMIELLGNTKMDERQRRYVTLAKSSCEALLSVISDILDFSSIQSGRLVLDSVEMSVQQVAEDAADLMGPRSSAKGLSVACLVNPGVPPVVMGDPARLRQVLVNLLSNAVKFTERGGVTLTVEPDDTVEHGVRFTVTDTGPGIPPDRLDRLFTGFTQIDNAHSRRHGGTGLGLAICNEIARLMGGAMGVSSREGEGSSFWLSVPLTPVAGGGATGHDRSAASRVMVCVVEPIAQHARVLVRQLELCGFRAHRCDDAAGVIQCFATAVPGTSRVLLVNPELSEGRLGLLARALDASEACRGVVRMLLSSANCTIGSEQWMSLGFVGTITTPVRQSTLAQRLLLASTRTDAENIRAATELLAPLAPEPVPAATEEPATVFKIPKVLVAEDNDVNQQLIDELLGQRGYYSMVVCEGAEAVERAMSGIFDVVLMDVQMPGMDGLEATRQIRISEAQQGRGRIPIIALTASDGSDDQQACLDAGMDDFLTKPIDSDALDQMIRKWIELNAAPARKAA